MLKDECNSLTGPGSGVRPRRGRAGSSALSVLAGAALMCAGTTAVALAAAHATSPAPAPQVCQPLPGAPPARPHPLRMPLPPLRVARAILRRLDRALAASPSSSSTPPPVDLCVSLQAVTATAQPGQAAVYRIRVWPSGGTVDAISVGLSLSTSRSSPPFHGAAFTYCGQGDDTATCVVGTLQPPGANELQAQASVPATAPSGDTVTLTATAAGLASGAASSGKVSASATVSIVAAPHTSARPTPTRSSSRHGRPHGSGSSGSAGGGLPSGLRPGGLPSLSSPSGSTTASNPSIEFPAISPGPDPTPVQPSRSARAAHGPYRASMAADVLPLNSGQLGAQVAGLIALVLGIALVIVRVSLRRPGGGG
jgi:hypothetical protein